MSMRFIIVCVFGMIFGDLRLKMGLVKIAAELTYMGCRPDDE
jgi:hypothetical protein